MDLLNRAYSQLYGLYRSMTPGSRLAMGMLVAVALLSLGYAWTHQASEPAVDLLHGMPVAAADLLKMEAAIGKANLKGYEVRGTSIYVPRGQEATYLTTLAAAGALPANSSNAEHEAVNGGTVLDLGPQREQRLRVARQEVLARAICKMSGIDSADVLYDVDPRPGRFQDKVLTATVLIKPVGAGRLDEALASEIQKMVAGAFAGMKPENVTVSDLNVAANSTSSVAATAGQNVPAQESPAPTFTQNAWNWASRPWNASGAIGLALASLLALRLIVLAGSATATARATATDNPDGKMENEYVDAPHAPRQRHFHAGNSPHREELSAIVEDDPDTAAHVLRSWIGQGSL